MIPLRALTTMLGINTRDFAAGWIEGKARYSAEGVPAVIPGSRHRAGSVAFAASQAAVAFYIGMESGR